MKCPKCGKFKVYKNGKKPVWSNGKRKNPQGYLCDSCGHQWRVY